MRWGRFFVVAVLIVFALLYLAFRSGAFMHGD
jgi:hypothetical protein